MLQRSFEELQQKYDLLLQENLSLKKQQSSSDPNSAGPQRIDAMSISETLLNSSQDLIQHIDLTGKFAFVNATWRKVLGFSPTEDLSHLNLFDLIHPDKLPQCKVMIGRLKKGEQVGDYQTIFVSQSGEKIHVKGTVGPYYQGEEISGFYGFLKNISKERRAQIELDEQTALFFSLIDSVPDLIFYKDLKGNYIGCNEAYLEFSGWKRHEFIGKNDTELFSAEEATMFKESDRIAVEQRIPARNEEWVDHPTKGRILLDTFKTAYFSDEGEPLGLIAISRDITNRVMAERKAVQHEKRYRSLFKNSPLGIVISGQDSTFTEVNDAFCSMMGYTREELIGQGMELITLPEDIALSKSNTTHLRQGEIGVFTFKKRYKSKSDQILRCIVTASGLNSQGNKIKETVVIVMNITQSELAEQARRDAENLLHQQNQELKKINRELDSFVYSAAHDLRAPITSVLGLIHLMELEDDPKTIQSFLELQKRSLRKLDDFIQDIVNFSKNARLDILKAQVNFETMLEEVFEQYKHLPQKTAIETRIRVNQSDPFISDPSRISNILNNLINNAYRYWDINKERPLIEAQVDIKDDHANIIISDNGQGIKKRHLESIFEMFYRANPKTPGSGLGLYITQEAVKKLRGKIEVRSEFGEGTTFLIQLPSLQTQAG